MSYVAKIEGTRYTVELEKKYNEWFLVLKIDGDPVEEIAVTQMSISSVSTQIENLLKEISYLINPLIIQKIIDELIGKSQHLFYGVPKEELSSIQSTDSTSVDYKTFESLPKEYSREIPYGFEKLREDIAMLMDSMQELNERVSEIDVRLSHVEKITRNLALITDKFLVESNGTSP